MKLIITFLLLITTFAVQAQQPDRQQFIRVEAPLIALTHVRVIDGTGAAALDDQTVLITEGKIQWVGAATNANIPANAQTIDLKGYTVLPGLVGMHNHMFFPMGGSPPMYSNMGFSFPRLYLALGVTTIRTTGSVAPYSDLEIKKLIDSGRMIGPKMHITAPYLEGAGAFTPVMHTLTGATTSTITVQWVLNQAAASPAGPPTANFVAREQTFTTSGDIPVRNLAVSLVPTQRGTAGSARVFVDTISSAAGAYGYVWVTSDNKPIFVTNDQYAANQVRDGGVPCGAARKRGVQALRVWL
jgi:hypothetical protein